MITEPSNSALSACPNGQAAPPMVDLACVFSEVVLLREQIGKLQQTVSELRPACQAQAKEPAQEPKPQEVDASTQGKIKAENDLANTRYDRFRLLQFGYIAALGAYFYNLSAVGDALRLGRGEFVPAMIICLLAIYDCLVANNAIVHAFNTIIAHGKWWDGTAHAKHYSSPIGGTRRSARFWEPAIENQPMIVLLAWSLALYWLLALTFYR
jgi:hypothetical protein